jgi:gamma-D-glutamyl-L-lysine dipeptidyl-peptidase
LSLIIIVLQLSLKLHCEKQDTFMKFGMCNLCMVPVRSEASHRSEMVTQLLFGELFEITEIIEGWVKVKLLFDGYEGWVDCKQYMPLYYETFDKLSNFGTSITLDLVHVMTDVTRDVMVPVVLGSSLPHVASNTFYIEDNKFNYDGNVRPVNEAFTTDKIVENAYMYLDAPYLWGGRSPFGIDCSGFTQMTYKLSGVKLFRDAHQQSAQGTTVEFISEVLPGDLAFFDNEEGNIVHAGIILANGQIIHASGKVRIDTIDHEGIYNAQLKKYTHRLRIIKRII